MCLEWDVGRRQAAKALGHTGDADITKAWDIT